MRPINYGCAAFRALRVAINDLTHRMTKSSESPDSKTPDTAEAFSKLNLELAVIGINPPRKPITPAKAAKCIACLRKLGLASVMRPQRTKTAPQ